MGVEPALQAGLIARASSMSAANYIFTPLRFALGVAVVKFPDFTVTHSLWSFSLTERGAYENYAKGYRAVIIVIRPTQINEIPRILQLLRNPDMTRIVITLVYDIEPEQQEIDARFGEMGIHVQVWRDSTLTDVLQQTTLRAIGGGEQDSAAAIPVMCIPTEACPPLERVESSCPQEVQTCVGNASESTRVPIDRPAIYKTNEDCRIVLTSEAPNADLKTDKTA